MAQSNDVTIIICNKLNLMPTWTIQDSLVLFFNVFGVNRVGDILRQFSVVLNILETEQFCLVLSAV